ncbi:MAG: DNA repair protein RadC [Paracoccaceae bacterium]|jgi:DNA repair protein RadC
MPPRSDRLFPTDAAPAKAPSPLCPPTGRVFVAPAGPASGGFAAPARGAPRQMDEMREMALPGLLTPEQEGEMLAAMARPAERAPLVSDDDGFGGPRAVPIPEHAQHRQRLREKFMRAGAVALHDYELLELVLFRAIPRRDVKPLAKRLLNMFGDFNHVVAAPASRLAEIEGVGDAVVQELKIIEAAAHSFAQAKVIGRNAISSWDALVTYCRQRMAHEEIEQFRILFLDRKNILIADEAQQVGTVDHVPVYPREVVKRALVLNASAIILVHNHPSGDPTPSQADIDMTVRICRACTAVGLSVHDHIVVGKERVASFHALGLID